MKKNIIIFVFGFIAFPGAVFGATCSQMNLTRCLDSVCAINVNSNPAARCQYCGTANAGTPPTSKAMQSLSLGQSARYTLTEKELKDAPTDPGQRYVWATKQCIEKVSGCTTDDVSEVYDDLIEQSCKAAGVTAQMNATIAAANNQTATESSCLTTIRACLTDEKRCGPDYSACAEEESFNNFFSSCSVEATGCGDYIAQIRTDLSSARTTAVNNAENLITSIVESYQTAREQKLYSAQAACKDNKALNDCINTICQRSMPNKCAPEASTYNSEHEAAEQFCKFYEVACELL